MTLQHVTTLPADARQPRGVHGSEVTSESLPALRAPTYHPPLPSPTVLTTARNAHRILNRGESRLLLITFLAYQLMIKTVSYSSKCLLLLSLSLFFLIVLFISVPVWRTGPRMMVCRFSINRTIWFYQFPITLQLYSPMSSNSMLCRIIHGCTVQCVLYTQTHTLPDASSTHVILVL